MLVTDLEESLLKKVNTFGRKNMEVISEEEANRVVRYLLKDEPLDLGGLTALRGFIYQYYVAVHYMVEMLHAEHAWWNEVIFEFLDDIALLGNDKIRFVQVKTVREDGHDRHLIPSTLLKRESGLDSWLDTLFKNITDFHSRKAEINRQSLVTHEFSLQFEIATEPEILGL